MSVECKTCLSLQNEVIFLRQMLRDAFEKQAILMTDTLVPKVQPQVYFTPTAIDDQGKIVKMDEPEKPQEEVLTDADVINHIIGH